MNLKQAKPVHIRCPKCNSDFAVNSNRIEEDYQMAKCKVSATKAEMLRVEQKKSKNSPEYKRLKGLHLDAIAQLTAIKKARTAVIQNLELQKYEIFKGMVKAKIGEQETIRMLQEAEEMMIYNDYDNAVQKSTSFNGV